MIKIELPGYEDFEKIRIKLDTPKVIEYKDGRKSNPNNVSFRPPELKEHEGRMGVYIILKNNKVGYVGATEDVSKRFATHKFIIRNPEIRFIYFLELKEKFKRYFYEIYYKYYYFKKVSPEYKGSYC